MIICFYTEINHQWSEQEFADKLVLLPEKLQQQVSRKRQWQDKQLSIAGKMLLLRVMKELARQSTLTDLQYNTYDRPYFDNGPDFNIAHSGSMVICCGTDNGQIGIDIEQVKEIDLADYTNYFTSNEWNKINHYPNKYDSFYDFWTRKEAVLKALGTGFHTPLSSVDVSGESLTYDDITYYLRPLIINQEYKCHIATTLASANIQFTRVDL
jgi:4'-phosphopantetheinyl transferase